MFINLTPHTINILDSNDQEVIAIPASGTIVRCSQKEEVFSVVDGVTNPSGIW